jgi:EAL domain-containing protein (putative c-di-GMP-specific phosphodiesterase class I)
MALIERLSAALPRVPSRRRLSAQFIALGTSLGMSVVAEGVKTAAQVEFLEANGCHRMQGCYFNRPVSMHALGRLMKKWPARTHRGMRHNKER